VLLSCDDSSTQAENSDAKALAPPAQASAEPATGEVTIPSNARNWAQIDNPAGDGWESEVLAGQAQDRLEMIGELLLRPTPATAQDLAPLLADDFAGSPLVPADHAVVFEDAGVRVERAAGDRQGSGNATAFLASINSVAREFRNARNPRAKFKIVHIEMEGEPARVLETRQFVSLSGETEKGVIEHHAKWETRWTLPAAGDADTAPKLSRLEVRNFERSLGKRPQPWFSDCTEAVLRGNRCYAEQLLRGMNYWLERIPYRAALNRMGTPGIAIGDVNGDGLDDLYLCQEPGLPNRLFLQQPGGDLRDVSADWGVDWLQDSRSALLADLDNDGRQDLAVALFDGIVVARNTGSRFEIRAVLPTSESTTSLTAADYDRDGRIDLYICAYSPDRTLEEDPQAIGPLGGRFVFHDAENGSPNTLYRNEITPSADWTFTDVTAATGLDQHNTRWSFAASWDDFDNDGDLDLYVANDYGRNCLYQSETAPDGAIRFRDVAGPAGAEDSASGMSAAWGDYDRDGWMDLYIGNMFSAAGSRVTRQAKFKPGISDELRTTFRHFARGNTLLRNLGQPGSPGFEDASLPAAVTVGRWAWGSIFADLNNDGWEDLVVANGYQSGDDDSGDL
jgi:hypothetical protein